VQAGQELPSGEDANLSILYDLIVKIQRTTPVSRGRGICVVLIINTHRFVSQQTSNAEPTEASLLITRISGEERDTRDAKLSSTEIFWEELGTIPTYALPVLWDVCGTLIVMLY
jgi:hypothetical protein